jgi:hypothetical protein
VEDFGIANVNIITFAAFQAAGAAALVTILLQGVASPQRGGCDRLLFQGCRNLVLERPEVVFAEFRAAGTTADITIRTDQTVAQLESARPSADIAHGVFVEPRLALRLTTVLNIFFHIQISHRDTAISVHS